LLNTFNHERSYQDSKRFEILKVNRLVSGRLSL
jgi:hypothetical protein